MDMGEPGDAREQSVAGQEWFRAFDQGILVSAKLFEDFLGVVVDPVWWSFDASVEGHHSPGGT
ncbi:hypothetical protein GCM10022267_60510 [Lentzea roselyniae]|uniref:Uncharacterized protein n=1 Tax=Lentzea roselyniae TaxID=531940 RepID=A0ABP7BNT0_9PSEU